jgi:hypothetical protein
MGCWSGELNKSVLNMVGMWKMTRLWESAKSADSHQPLGKVVAKARRLSHISHKPYYW